MFVWHIQVAGECRASPEVVYRLWTDVSHWPMWDHEIEWAKLDGPFVAGSKGTLKLRGKKPVSFTVRQAEKNKRCSVVIKKLFTTIACICQIDLVSNKEVHVTQSIIVGGLLAPFYKRTWGKALQKSLPIALRRFVELIQRHV